jgi:hypothetical protein
MPDWLKTVDVWPWVTYIAGLLTPRVVDLGYSLVKGRIDSKIPAMRESLYTELRTNIGALQNMLDLVQQGSHEEPHVLVSKFVTDNRYQAAKKDGDTFYRMKEADLIDGLYKDFKRLSDGSESHPIEYTDVVIAHFFTRVSENVLNKKLMKQGATPWVLAKIRQYTPPPWWKFWAKPPKPVEDEP